MSHAVAGNIFQFGAARFGLGIGESANFPAAVKTVAEWFPRRERALATGFFNSGSNLGVRVDLFKQDGTALSGRLNHQSGNTFIIPLIFPGAAFTLAPRDTNGNS